VLFPFSIRQYLPWLVFCLVVATPYSAIGQDNIPTTTGFSGYFLIGPGVFSVRSNLLVTGPPLVGEAGKNEIASIHQSPQSKKVAAFPLAGEIHYTFSKSRTQLFFGNKLEDILRLDVPYGLGARQLLPDSSILALSVLITPLELKFWEDPYIENEERIRTGLSFPGVRLRWGRILKTGLELTATTRWYQHDEEKSGDWLISEGRLDPDLLPLLNRDGRVTRVQVLYRIDLKGHRFEPAFRFIDDNHDGKAMARKGYGMRLTYLYLSPKIVLDANLAYGKRNGQAIHPVYNEYLDANRYGAAISAFIPIKIGKSKYWNIWASAEFFSEDSNIDFFDSSFGTVMGGLLWRKARK